MVADMRFPAESLKYNHFESENKNLEALEILQRLIMFYEVAFNEKLYSNLGDNLFRHRCRNYYPFSKKKAQ